MKVKVKLETSRLPDAQFVVKSDGIVTSMTGNTNFTTPAPTLASVTTATDAMRTLMNAREAILSQAAQMTTQIDAQRDVVQGLLTDLAEYVETTANASTDPGNPPEAIVESAGMSVVATGSPIGPMPQVEGLVATTGDAEGEIDLGWGAIRRGLKSFIVEMMMEGSGSQTWNTIAVVTKSSATIPGLTPGVRYHFRVAAVGTAGQGPWSATVSKFAA